MPKTKNNLPILSEKVQFTFLSVSLIVYVITATYWISLLVRVYPNGMRFSEFSVAAMSEIIFPIILFAIAYLTINKSISRLNRLFKASLFAFMGFLVLIWAALLSRWIMSSSTLFSEWPAHWNVIIPLLVTLIVYIGFVIWPNRPTGQVAIDRRLQVVFLAIASVSFVLTAILGTKHTIGQYLGDQDIINLLTDSRVVVAAILPAIFFAIAYRMISTGKNLANRLFATGIYTITGIMIAHAIALLCTLSIWYLSVGDSYPELLFTIQTAVVTWISLLVYGAIIVCHGRAKK
ncbi:MAG TPA: hypothetical protein VFM68_01180 [Candidatus Saccharimonadales bacterium]|nr:hypothetical protein [Candidatus Saccharimonadales bacterium]